MKKLTRDFFNNEEVALVGLSRDKNAYSQMVYKAMVDKSIKVYPVNKHKDDFDMEVFEGVEALPDSTTVACLLLNPENMSTILDEVLAKGIKKVMVRSIKQLSDEAISKCDEMKVELVVGCPLMALGSGLHRFHGFLAGVK